MDEIFDTLPLPQPEPPKPIETAFEWGFFIGLGFGYEKDTTIIETPKAIYEAITHHIVFACFSFKFGKCYQHLSNKIIR